MQNDRVLIVGASTRAAAFSALRAGLSPWCLDLFADADLQARCLVQRVSGRYPHSLPAALAQAPPAPWLYTGGLENHPALVDRLARQRPLWGNAGAVLRRVRDPLLLSQAARAAGLPAPQVWCRLAYTTLPPDHQEMACLVKPLAGASGIGIRFHHPDAPFDPRREYLQQFIPGTPVSALFVAWPGGCRLLGATLQLIGTAWLHASPFRYCGNIGPIPAPAGLEALGRHLADNGLRGLFGIDGIHSEGQFWPIEVNPRYTAAVEVLEQATGLRALHLHRLACIGAFPEAVPQPADTPLVGKAILYAPVPIRFPAVGPWQEQLTHSIDTFFDFADLPHPGDSIPAGRPVLTLFGRGDSVSACEAQLRAKAAEITALLQQTGAS